MADYLLATPVIQPRLHFFKDGKPLIGGKVYTYKVGIDEFKPTFRDAELTALNQNPIVLDSAGSCLVYMSGSVLLKVYDQDDQLVENRIAYQQQYSAQFFDKLGKPLKFGKVWTLDYRSTLKKPSFKDTSGGLNQNPVLLDSDGKASISMIGAYRLRVLTQNDALIGDQDLKREPARVLTSKPYPAYFYEELSTNFDLRKMARRLDVNQVENIERIYHQFALNKVIRSSITNQFELTDSVAAVFALDRVVKRSLFNQINIIESVGTSFGLTKMHRRRTVIQNTAEIENITTSFALSKVSKVEA